MILLGKAVSHFLSLNLSENSYFKKKYYSEKKWNFNTYSEENISFAFSLIEGHQIEEFVFYSLVIIIEENRKGSICVFEKTLLNILKKNHSYIINSVKETKLGETLFKDILSSENLLANSNDFEKLKKELMNYIKYDLNSFYFNKNLEYETNVAKTIKNLLQINRNIKLHFPKNLKNYKNSENIQRFIQEVLNRGFSTISGGPGTGKSTLIKLILETALLSGISENKILIATPTGKSAKRLEDELNQNQFYETYKSLQPPVTLHRILGYNENRNDFYYNQNNLLNYNLIIIDEASMVNLELLNALFQSINFDEIFKLCVILLGDPDQLLSIDLGACFFDLTKLKNHNIELDSNFRIQEKSNKLKKLVESFQKNIIIDSKSFSLNQLKEDAKIDFYENQDECFPKLKIWFESVQDDSKMILSPIYNHTLGVNGINDFFHNLYSINNFDQFNLFYEKEPVLVTRNFYDYNLMNGEIGYLEKKEDIWYFKKKSSESILLRNDIIPYLKLAFAISIHKSQGSEYDHVCLVLPNNQSIMIEKRLIYTAITRAKKSISIITSKDTWDFGINNVGTPRESNLIFRILNEQK